KVFHVGANEDQVIKVDINDMSAAALGVEEVNISTQGGADDAISAIDDAIKQVSQQRANLGAVQNRLEHTIANLGVTIENLQASESRIRDADMAKEMSEFVR